MILLWGLSGDDPFDEVTRELRAQRATFVLLDQRHALATRAEIDAAGLGGWIDAPSGGFSLHDITAAYVRMYDSRQLPGVRRADPAHIEAVGATERALWSWLDLAPGRVLNRPSAMASNDSKPYQSQLIRDHGFSVPETLVTTDPDAARAFWRRHGDVIYKSVSSLRSIVSRLTLEHVERMQDVQWCPTQLQAYVGGRDFRVHVVGDRLFATQVESSADDYRYANRQNADVTLSPASLPDDVAARCLRLSRALDLPLAGIDLRLSLDGDWYCFEVNPSPCFTYYQYNTHQPIAEAIGSYLAGRSPGQA